MGAKEILRGDWKMLRIMIDEKQEIEIFADKLKHSKGKIYHLISEKNFKSFNKKCDLERELTNKNLRLLETKFQ
ncbi:MAG: hypothetical protein ACRCYT_09495 [Cetobacterium sp.]